MRPLRYFVILFFVLLATVTSGNAQSKDDQRLSITKDVMDKIAHGDLNPVVERFNAKLKETATLDHLKAVVDELTAITGPFQKHLLEETRTVQGTPVYVARSQFQKFKVELGLEFDDSDQIDHLWIAPVSDLSPEDMEASAKAVTNLLSQERFDLLSEQFNEQLKEMMSTDHLDESWSHVIQHLGKFKLIKRVEKNPEYEIVDVRCEFEHGEIIVRVAYDVYGKVSFIWMLPLDEAEPSNNNADFLVPEPMHAAPEA